MNWKHELKMAAITAGAIAVILHFAGCSTIGSIIDNWPTNSIPVPVPDPVTPAVSSDLPEIGSGTISGWGPVNMHWKMSEAELEKCFVQMQADNVRFWTVEAVGNAKEDVLAHTDKYEQVKSRLLFEAKQCHQRGIWFAPIVANDNAGDGGYQNGGYPISKRLGLYKEFVDWMAEALLPYASCTIITPVAETQSNAGRSLESYCAAKLGKFRLCYNGSSRPSGNSSWSKFFCYHPTSTSQWPASKSAIVLSDCGSTIRQLNLGGDINGNGNPAAIQKWLADGVARGQVVVAVYAFQTAIADVAAIHALARPQSPSTPNLDPVTPPSGKDYVDINSLEWNARDGSIANWPITTDLAVSFDSQNIWLKYDKGGTWEKIDDVNANAWAVIQLNGKWNACTWEFLHPGTKVSRPKGCLDHTGGKGDHFEIGALKGHVVKKGDRLGIMVSGLCRHRNQGKVGTQERSQIVEVVWP